MESIMSYTSDLKMSLASIAEETLVWRLVCGRRVGDKWHFYKSQPIINKWFMPINTCLVNSTSAVQNDKHSNALDTSI